MQCTDIFYLSFRWQTNKKKCNSKQWFRAAKELNRKEKNMAFHYEKCQVIL